MSLLARRELFGMLFGRRSQRDEAREEGAPAAAAPVIAVAAAPIVREDPPPVAVEPTPPISAPAPTPPERFSLERFYAERAARAQAKRLEKEHAASASSDVATMTTTTLDPAPRARK